VIAVGAATTVVITGSSSEGVKESAVPFWASTAHRVVDPGVNVVQSTVEVPAALWNTRLLENVGDEADWDALNVAWPTETHDADVVEVAQLVPSKKLTETVELPMSVCPDEVSCNCTVMVSGQLHRCGLKRTLRSLESRALPEFTSEA